MATPETKSTMGLFGDALDHVTSLIRKEVELAKAETGEKVSRMAGGTVFLGIGAILMLVALNVLAAALVNWVAASGLDAGWAALIVGGGIIVLALIFLLVGRSRIKPKGLMPERTARNVRSDVDVVRGKTHA